ncbi:MAG: thioesterase family protein [Candidatus Methanoplasma sp.]|jgi:predicted thioesterase|nr:thioesterase family protein [Candidatus Methanoplasma sp.]
MIRAGITHEGKMKVENEVTAESMGSGTLPVFATPAMILLIERTATECLMPLLNEGESTVGTHLEIRHSAPSLVGSEIYCRVKLAEADRLKLVFDVKVWDSAGEVGFGRHERFLVDEATFMERAASRTQGEK